MTPDANAKSAPMLGSLCPGDYVLATKYDDGDTCDHFCVGFLDNPIMILGRDRFMVIDDRGVPYRANGFRRAEKITKEEGDALVAVFPNIANIQGPSLWDHLCDLRGQPRSVIPENVEPVIELLSDMTDEERLAVFERFCVHCGCIQPESGRRCQCWNDE